MGVRELITDMKENSDKYFQERNPLYAEEFLGGYCVANCDLSDKRLDRNFYSYFKYWMPYWIEKNIAPPYYIKEGFGFQGYQKILPKEKEAFAYFLELCDLCIQDYDTGGSILFFTWCRKRPKEGYHNFLRDLLLHKIKLRPGMYVRDFRLDFLYYDLLGRCLAHHEAGAPYEEIEATFCRKFGEWLLRWIRENVDRNYTSQSKYWYEDIRRILPKGKEELTYFLELCELFFEEYDGRKGFAPYEIPERFRDHKVIDEQNYHNFGMEKMDALFPYICKGENTEISTLDYSAYINEKCITQEMLGNFICEYSGIYSLMTQLNEHVIRCSGLSDYYDFFIYFHYSEDRHSSNFRHSTILKKDFHYVQHITVSMAKELCGRGFDKKIIEFFFFLKSKISCDMLIADLFADICFISGDDITWLLRRSCLLKIPNPHWQDSKEERYEIGSVRAVSLFTSDKVEIENIYLQWQGEEAHISFEPDSIRGNLQEEGIYVVFCGDFVARQEDETLQQLNISDSYCYAIHYSNRETMKYFIEKTRFPANSYMDNGESILPLEEIRKDILGFIK